VRGNAVENPQKKRMHEHNRKRSAQSEQKQITQTHASFYVEFPVGIIPPFGIEQRFQKPAGCVFDQAGNHKGCGVEYVYMRFKRSQ